MASKSSTLRRRTASEDAESASARQPHPSRRHTVAASHGQAANHKNVTVTGQCFRGEGGRVGTKLTFKVNTPIPGVTEPGVSVTSPAGDFIDVDMTSRVHGVYQYRFTPDMVGVYTVMICYKEMNVDGSPFKVNVEKATKSSKSSRYVPSPTHAEVLDIPSHDVILSQNRQNETKQNSESENSKEQPTSRIQRRTNPSTGLEKCRPWPRVSQELKIKLRPCLLIDAELTLGRELGKGQFGKVREARLHQTGHGATLVAAKSIRNAEITDEDVQEFLSEALLMSNFHHKNVLELVGVVVRKDYPYILFPVMINGCLRDYLVNHKNGLEMEVLLSFGHQVASGMEYISGLKFVHRDLAARNCLVNKCLTVKVSDFGLARDNFARDYRMVKTHKRLPLRWLAPEIPENWIFTTETDVWAYGILLWEIFTCGDRPYGEMNDKFLGPWLQDGSRLSKPKQAPQEIYEIMLSCWEIEPNCRPSFSRLAARLQVCIDDDKQSRGYVTASSRSRDDYVNIQRLSLDNEAAGHEYSTPPPPAYGYVNVVEGKRHDYANTEQMTHEYSNQD